MKNIGILAVEVYFPNQYVDQEELEKDDGCVGKYTIGLGQKKMGVCGAIEDINSLCLTVTNNLLINHNIDPRNIGFLEVGTESILDKSKSTQSILMQLFESYNTDIQGADVKNACFGGTAAFLHAIDWLDSSSWDGRLAIVVAGDIAVYSDKSARCTGGAGAVAMLLGPNAPVVFDEGVSSSYMSHQWDFYKPILNSEYPVFDGQFSIRCYQKALDNCFRLYKEKCLKRGLIGESSMTFQDKHYFCFHSPFTKLVQKSFARLVFADLRENPDIVEQYRDQLTAVLPYLNLNPSEIESNRDLNVALMTFCKQLIEEKVDPSLLLAKNIGNMYTASVYSCLISTLINVPIEKLCGSRIILFSYGSGLKSCMFSFRVTTDLSDLVRLTSPLQSVPLQLEQRRKLSLEEFEGFLMQRDALLSKCNAIPAGDVKTLSNGTFFLSSIDEKYRRHYKVHNVTCNGVDL